jgi:hypothetical protein
MTLKKIFTVILKIHEFTVSLIVFKIKLNF